MTGTGGFKWELEVIAITKWEEKEREGKGGEGRGGCDRDRVVSELAITKGETVEREGRV